MSNDYFNHSKPLARHTLGRATTVNEIFEAIVAGFGKLPAPLKLAHGKVSFSEDTGSANACVAAMAIPLTSYEDGTHIRLRVNETNTGASTLNIDGVGIRSIKLPDGADVGAGDLVADQIRELVFSQAENAFILQGMVETNYQRILEANQASADQASESAENAAESATLAGNKVTEAGEKVTEAGDKVVEAETARDLAQAFAAAAGAVSGIPVLSGNAGKLLAVNVTEDGVEWVELEESSPWHSGDLLMSLAPLTTPWLLADGGAAAQSSQPALYSILGDSWEYGTDPADKITVDVNPTGQCFALSFNDDESYFAVGHANSPYVSMFAWNAGSPQKVANPATLPTNGGRDVMYSPSGAFLAVAHDTSPFVTFFNTSTPGSPVKMTNPATLPPANGYGVSWTPDSRYCAHAAYTGSGCLTIYDLISGAPVKLVGKPSVQPSGTGWCARYSPDGNYLAVGTGSAPFITIYDNSDPANPSKLADPASLPSAIVRECEWSPDSRYLLVQENGPGKKMYDLSTGVPVEVPMTAEAVASGNVGFSWRSNTEVVAMSTNFDILEVKDGTVSVRETVLHGDSGLTYALSGMHFRDQVGENHVVAVSQAAPYVVAQARDFDPTTHFRLPNFGVDSDTFNPSGGGADLPKVYLMGEI